MHQLPGYPDQSNPTKVCRLRKTLNSLKQSGRRWYQWLVEIMTALGFLRCEVDQAVFYRRKEKMLMIVLVHVDDCTVVGTSIYLINKFKTEISKHVEITDLGEIHWILGIEIHRNCEQHAIHLSQHSYIESSL